MLPRKHRLAAARDFARLFKAKKAYRGQNIDLRVGPNSLDVVRVGFSVGVKVDKRAVVRNLLKRRLREIVRGLLPKMVAGHDLLISAKAGSQTLTYKELSDSVIGLLTRSGSIPHR